MTITITPAIKNAAVDAAERAVKTFAGGFIVGAGLLGAAVYAVSGQVTVAASQINWAHGLDVGAGTTVVSLLFSLASLKLGNEGTASVTKSVVGAFKLKGSEPTGMAQ
ncbi:holin [Mycobacterium sp. NPDC050853]|uniref:holin n=1 Tax=Mycobacterium sp. NPDC050853 TaxID=3155160 RepID=UPI0033E8491F